MRKPSVLVIFLTVFIDLIGFGIIVPLIPSYSEHFGAHGIVIGVIFASFSAMQFIFSPIWGRLSDRYGRRPILLISTAGAAASYVLFARSTGLENHTAALWLMVASRMFAGICGGNITVAQAYIADITPPAERSKKMGLIGMAFGLGFILGPFIGAESLRHLGDTGPGWVAAALCAANFLLACFILTESHKPDSAQAPPRPHLDQWAHTLRQPKVGFLVIVFFLATFCFSCFRKHAAPAGRRQLPSRLQARCDLGQHHRLPVCLLRPHRRARARRGHRSAGQEDGRAEAHCAEPRPHRRQLRLDSRSSRAPRTFPGKCCSSRTACPGCGCCWRSALLSVGTSLTRPPLFGMLSNLTPANEQGATIGVAQGAGSLARILGPIFATALLAYSPPLPYLICAVVLLGTTGLGRPTIVPGQPTGAPERRRTSRRSENTAGELPAPSPALPRAAGSACGKLAKPSPMAVRGQPSTKAWPPRQRWPAVCHPRLDEQARTTPHARPHRPRRARSPGARRQRVRARRSRRARPDRLCLPGHQSRRAAGGRLLRPGIVRLQRRPALRRKRRATSTANRRRSTSTPRRAAPGSWS